jgi:transcriptional regulator with XRE-family HTH domain
MGKMSAGKPARSTRTDFARRLTALREAAGLSQRDMARQLGISQPSYVNWEQRNVSLRPEQLTLLARILGVGVAVLLEGEHAPAQRNGLSGKLRQVFERVNQLPRHQQNKVIEFVEAFVNQQARNE